ncbi:MAG: hypothetical protein IJ156_00815 [Bacteroidales bacterium]|nr:hypothetical protein [Bacteroidales bacterium]
MKTNISNLVLAAALLPLLFSCNKAAEPVSVPDDGLVTISATIPDGPATRVAAAAAETGLAWKWEERDQITVVGVNSSVFDIEDGFTAHQADFTGKPVAGSAFSILYPGSYDSVAELEAAAWTGQVQTGNGSMDHLKYCALLSGVDAFETFEFSDAWAAEHGGSFRQSGVLKFALTLPEGVTAPESVAVRADEPVFYADNAGTKVSSLGLELKDVTLGEDRVLTAWMTLPWQEVKVPAGTALTVTVVADGGNHWQRSVTLSAEASLLPGKVNTIVLDATGWTGSGHYAGGEGTAESPWLIADAASLRSVRGDLVSGETKYFKLVQDIDISGAEWAPLNNEGNFDKFFDFDGNGKTIKGLTITEPVAYASFAGILYGTLRNVTFDGANIVAGNNKAGIAAGYVGTNKSLTACSMTGVTVKDSAIEGATWLGGLIGQVAIATTVSDCHVIRTTVTSSSDNVGGLVAVPDCAGVRFENCSTEGVTIRHTAAKRYMGGFVGNINKATVFERCTVKDAVLDAPSSQRVGGFVGQAGRFDGAVISHCTVENATITGSTNSAGFVGVNYCPDINKCAVVGGTITANGNNVAGFAGYPEGNATLACKIADSYSTMKVVGGERSEIGGFIGIAKGLIAVERCYAAGEVNGTHANTGAFVGKVDVATAAISACIGWNATLPFAGFVVDGAESVKDNYAGNEGTVSSQAIALGWPADVWDLSGDAPKLK